MHSFYRFPLVCRIFACAALVFLFAGCAPVPTAAPAATPEPQVSAEPTATPEPAFDPEAVAAAAKEAFFAVLSVDLSLDTLPEMASIQDFAANFPLFFEMADAIESAVRSACSKAYLAASEPYEDLPSLNTELSLPRWQEVVSLYRVLGDDLEAVLQENLFFTAEADEKNILCSVSLPQPDEIFGTYSDEAFSYKLILAYMNTIYDDKGTETDYVYPEPQEGYIATVTDPLPGHRIKDGWYAPRSENTRKHTGTDIRAAEDTPILSCTAGTVVHIGSNAMAGNYVAVLDEYGYEYHYYHMVRLTDFLSVGDTVAAGDVIGHVGNTGNSDANHLHLAVITPECYYLNPYFLLLEVRETEAKQGNNE